MTLTAHGRMSLTGAALGVAAILVAGCSSASSSSSTATAPSSSGAGAGSASSSAPTSVTPTTGTSTAPSSGSSAHASGVAACATTDLNVTVGSSEGAAGSVYTVLDFTNIGSASCTLYGYPGVSLADSGSTQIGAAATRNPMHSPSLVTLAPAAKANVTLQVAEAQNYPTGTCSPKQTAYLRIFPPNQTQAIEVPFKTTGCTKSSVKLLSVTVVASGAGSAN
jgi:Protein of unknown function (DUF4232)